ncbi:MAG TPA: RNA polymerase sigma factor [Acidimicrobiales bacterium]|nr:RNA polymerase sigma factor [Acidimicrobiales bacterium]
MDEPDETSTAPARRSTIGRSTGRAELPGRPHAVPDPVPDPDHVERQALLKAQRGDNRSFARLIRTHDPALRTVATFLVGTESVDTVLHDAYVRAYRALPRYKGDLAPRLWLTRPVVSVALDLLRKRHRPRPRRAGAVRSPAETPPPAASRADEVPQPDPASGVRILAGDTASPGRAVDDEPAADPRSPAPSSAASTRAPELGATPERDSALSRLHRAFDELLLEDRIALTLVDVAELTVAEAAATVEVEQPTMATRLGRARGSVRRTLNELADSGASKVWTPPPMPDPDDLDAWFDLQPVEDHGAEFWPSVGAKLLDAKYRPAASGPEPRTVGGVRTKRGPDDGTTPGAGKATVKVATKADDRTIGTLARQARHGRGRSWGWLRQLVVVAVGVGAAVGLIFAGFAISNRVSHRDAQLGTTAGKIIARVNDAMSTDQVISGAVTVDSGGSPVAPGTYEFVRSPDGSYKIAKDGGGWTEAYDNATGTFTQATFAANGAPITRRVETGVAPGPPDPSATTGSQLGDPLVGVIQLLAQGSNTQLTTLGNNGAPQYVIDSDLPLSGGRASGADLFAGIGAFSRTAAADHVRVLIDQSLELPTDVQLTRDQGSVMHLRFADLAVGNSAGSGQFTVAAPDGATTTSRGYEVVPLNGVTSAVGYDPAKPSYLPGGFTLSSVAVQPESPAGSTSTAGGRNPPNSAVVVLVYRHGGDTIVVTTRRTTSAAGKFWLDPLATTGDGATHSVDVTAGRLLEAGARGSDRPVPHLWARDRDLVYTVTGTVSLSQLTKVASSLQ